MFTGIVEEAGRVESAARRGELMVVRIAARVVTGGLARGGSVAVNGCCLTAVDVTQDGFACELTPETLARTRFDERLRAGVRVNLERPLRADGRFEGHIVQGHVDGVGRVVELRTMGESAELQVAAPAELQRYLVLKGSVALDGVSLTVAALGDGVFGVALIPYTLKHTSLGDARPGGHVNLEADLIAKYVERLLGETPLRR